MDYRRSVFCNSQHIRFGKPPPNIKSREWKLRNGQLADWYVRQMYEKPNIRPSGVGSPRSRRYFPHNGTSLIFKRLMNRINTNMRKSIPVSACVSKKASRSARRSVRRFPMIFPQISPRLAYSLTVLALNRKTSAASHMVSSRFPLTVGFAVLLPVRNRFQSSTFRAHSA